MAMQELYAYQGFTKNYQALQINNNDGLPATGIYTSGSTLSATVGEGQNQASLFSPTVSWYTANSTQTGYGQGQFSISFAGSATTSLNPAGEYYVYVSQTTSGVSSLVWMGRLKILATPGSVSPQPPDLCTYDFAEAYCSSGNLTDTQRDNLPYFVTAASNAIRIRTNRNFDLRTYVKKFDVTIYGIARLDQIPIQQILRVQGPQQLALTISNNSQSVQFAQAYFAYTGTVDGYGSNIQTATGITLNWASSGTITNTTVSFTAGETISTLASAINAVGSGWSAVADSSPSGYGNWPVTELDGGYVGQGAALSALPSIGANFYVLSDLSNTVLDDPWRGFLSVGRQLGNFNASQWGPGGNELWDTPSRTTPQQVKVTFAAGQSTIPQEIQVQCAELTKWKIELSKNEKILASERAADYQYAIAKEMIQNMPKNVQQALAPFTVHYA